MEEVLNALANLNKHELTAVKIAVDRHLAILAEREQLLRNLKKHREIQGGDGADYAFYSDLQRDREKSGFGQ